MANSSIWKEIENAFFWTIFSISLMLKRWKKLKIKIHMTTWYKKNNAINSKKKMSQEIYISTYLFGQLKTPIFQTNKTTYLYLKPKSCNISTPQLLSCKYKHIWKTYRLVVIPCLVYFLHKEYSFCRWKIQIKQI